MKQRTHLLMASLASCLLAIPVCEGSVVFSDDFSEAPGTAILEKSPDVGSGPWTQGSANGVTVSAANTLDTAGKSIQIFGAFTAALGAGQILTLECDSLVPASGSFLVDNTSWGGISLYTGHTTGSTGTERMFAGNPSAGFWGVDGAATGRHFGSDSTETTHVTFTYVYSTGEWTLSTTSGYTTNGTGTANLALNALRIGNGASNPNFDNISVDISAVPVFSFFARTPADGSYSASVTNVVSVQTTDGTSPVNTASIVLKVDGGTVTPVITKSANVTTISYVPAAPLSAGALHTAQVTLADTGGTSYTNTWSFNTGYPSLPVSLAGPFTASNGVDKLIFSQNGEGWLGTNYNTSSSKTLYTRYSMVFNDLNGETGSGGGYGGLHFFQDDTQKLIVGSGWLSLNWGLDAAGLQQDLDQFLPVVLGEWHTIVVRTDYNPSGADTVRIWLDPDFNVTEATQPVAPTTLTTVDAAFNNIRLRCGNGTANATWTNIIVATTSAGVGFVAPSDPQFQGLVPGANAVSVPPASPVGATILFGSYGISANNIALNLDGDNVTPAFTVSPNSIVVTYQPPVPFTPGSTHNVTLSLVDANATPYSTSWSFTVDLYPSLPVVFAASTNGTVDVSGGGAGTTIWDSQNGWLDANYGETSTNELFARFTMNFLDLNNESGSGGGFGGLHFFRGNTEVLLLGNNWNSTSWSIDHMDLTPDLDLTPVTPIVLGEWHTVVARIAFAADADDTITIWLDPDFSLAATAQPNPPLTFTANNAFDSVHLRTGDGGAYGQFTNIIMAATSTGVGFAAQQPQSVLSIQSAGSNVNVSWTGTGILQESATVTGTWTDSASQTNPQSRPSTGSAMFFRLRQ